MARPPACHSPYWNLLLTGKDELAGPVPGPVPTKSSNTSTSAPAVLRVPTSAPPVTTVIASSPAPVLKVTTLSLDNELFKQFIKHYLEAQVQAQIALEIDPKPCKQPLKARFSNLYYGNLHIDCYQFCQQWKLHFETIRAKGPNRILFATLFLRGSVS